MSTTAEVHGLHTEDVDVLASLLDVHRLETVLAGRVDLGSPWRLEAEPSDLLVVTVQARGTSHLHVPGCRPYVMEARDVMIQPHGSTRRPNGPGYLHDGSHPAAVTRRLPSRARSTPTPTPLRLGPADADATCSMVFCLMRLQGPARGPLWETLPDIMHVPSDRSGLNGQLRRTVESIIEESNAPGPASARLLARLAETLLILALRVQAHTPSSGPGLRSLVDPVIAPAVQLIHNAPGEPWTVASLAAHCGLSRSAFAARFVDAVGETPAAYLTGWRVATAGNLLATTDQSIARIAETVGYSSEGAFRLAFLARAGMTPREYRRAYRA